MKNGQWGFSVTIKKERYQFESEKYKTIEFLRFENLLFINFASANKKLRDLLNDSLISLIFSNAFFKHCSRCCLQERILSALMLSYLSFAIVNYSDPKIAKTIDAKLWNRVCKMRVEPHGWKGKRRCELSKRRKKKMNIIAGDKSQRAAINDKFVLSKCNWNASNKVFDGFELLAHICRFQ